MDVNKSKYQQDEVIVRKIIQTIPDVIKWLDHLDWWCGDPDELFELRELYGQLSEEFKNRINQSGKDN